jgi:putative acetyltransferase
MAGWRLASRSQDAQWVAAAERAASHPTISAVIVRSERPADYDAIRTLVTLAMRSAEAELVDLIRVSEHYVPDLALVAEEADGLAGYALFSYVPLEGAAPGPVLALAPLCVRPDRQRRGVGSALVGAGLARADALGAPLVTVLGDPAYYGRLGFEPAHRFGVEPPGGVPEDHFRVRPLSGWSDRFQGRVVYPPAFDVV